MKNNNLLAEISIAVLNSVPSSFFVDVIPALDGVSFSSDLIVSESEFLISDLISLADPGNEELLEVKIAENSFLEIKPAGTTEFIPFNETLTLTREQLSSGGQDALFRKAGNFVGTSVYWLKQQP